jgi:hypothetical protein
MGRPLWREDRSVVYNCWCLRQRSHSQIRVPRGSIPQFTVSDLRLPQPGGPGPCIYIPQEQGGPVIPPGTDWSILVPFITPSTDRLENTERHCCISVISVGTLFLGKSLLSNGCRIFAYSTVVAVQRTFFIESLLSKESAYYCIAVHDPSSQPLWIQASYFRYIVLCPGHIDVFWGHLKSSDSSGNQNSFRFNEAYTEIGWAQLELQATGK